MCGPMAGAIFQGVGSFIQMQSAAKSEEMQAKLSEKQAEERKAVGKYRAERAEEAVQRVGGQQRAVMAEGGLDIGFGSAVAVQEETAREGDLDVQSILWSTKADVESKKYEAKIYRQNARGARAAAPFAFLSPILSQAPRMGTSWGTT